MDISSIIPQTRVIEIKHPATDEPIGVRVTLRSPDSKEVRDYYRKRAREAGEEIDVAVDFALAVMASWEWYGKDVNWRGDNSPKLDRETVSDVLATLAWFEKQINAEVADAKGFFIA